jgi:hypothetical protein
MSWVGIVLSVWRLGTGLTVLGSKVGGTEIFHIRPDRPWSPPSLQYNYYCICFPGIKRPGRGVNHTPTSSAEVKERVEIYVFP